KGYASVDPNEDAVLGAAGPAGRVLAVADGHNGVEASHAALRALAAHAEGLVTGPGHGGEVVARLFEEAISATTAALDGVAPPRRGPRRHPRRHGRGRGAGRRGPPGGTRRPLPGTAQPPAGDRARAPARGRRRGRVQRRARGLPRRRLGAGPGPGGGQHV